MSQGDKVTSGSLGRAGTPVLFAKGAVFLCNCEAPLVGRPNSTLHSGVIVKVSGREEGEKEREGYYDIYSQM